MKTYGNGWLQQMHASRKRDYQYGEWFGPWEPRLNRVKNAKARIARKKAKQP